MESTHHHRLELPAALRLQLDDFRRHVGRVKLLEAIAVATAAVLSLWLVVFACDRLWDTTAAQRTVLLVLAVACMATVPLACYRWIWRQRQAARLARVLERKLPYLGDQLLGILELVENPTEQARSPSLCAAAIEQVAEDVDSHDLRAATPATRHRGWSAVALLTVVVGVGLLALCPAAAINAVARLLAPWQTIPRYTFVLIEPLPEILHVAHGEPFSVIVKLTDQTLWLPAQSKATLGAEEPIRCPLHGGQYQFDFSGQIEPGHLKICVGDTFLGIRIEPTVRPELTQVVAQVLLPDYLGLPEPIQKDVRGGAISLVQGSRATIVAIASRPLATAQVDGAPQQPDGSTITSQELLVESTAEQSHSTSSIRTLEFQWRDRYQLAGREPFALSITGIPDQPPTLACENLPRRRVVLDSEQLVFQIKAHDDFGVQQLGIQWQSLDQQQVASATLGERIVAAGGHDQASLDVTGTFSALALGIEPQWIGLRVFVEDYRPDRARVYSPTYLLQVLDAREHAIWLSGQLNQWHRRALEVRDRELQLYDTNRQLHELAAHQLAQADVRRQIKSQAAAERANGNRLSQLYRHGVELLRQAARNPQFGDGYLEKWAAMLNLLQDISAHRMPAVAERLRQAAKKELVAGKTGADKAAAPARSSPQVGKTRATAADGNSPAEPLSAAPVVPQISDVETSSGLTRQDHPQPPPGKGDGEASLSLPATTLLGGGPRGKASGQQEKVHQAVRIQQELLTHFEKIADELNQLLANLEGSTLVKRLKGASRVQDKIAAQMGGHLAATFGLPATQIEPSHQRAMQKLALLEKGGSENVSQIMDDMQGYFERRRLPQFKTVLDEMRAQNVIAELYDLGNALPTEQGMSMAQCEYWSDLLDRWAEDLVDSATSGTSPDSKSRGSLPPSIVLEVMRILEAEVNLREQTRVAEQARPALEASLHHAAARKLAQVQDRLQQRVEDVMRQIRELPAGQEKFVKEILLFGQVVIVMDEAASLLHRFETGSATIGAETEVIERLLQSGRMNPNGGGGGGALPGGGGGGSTQESALAMLGIGINEKEVREERPVMQALGNTSSTYPEEFRTGLDEYFQRLEKSGQEGLRE